MFKTSFFYALLATIMALSCSKALQEDPMPLGQKPGIDHNGKAVSSLSAAQERDFFSFMQESGRVEDATSVLNAMTPGAQPQSDDAKTQSMAVQMVNCKRTSVDTSGTNAASRFEIGATVSGTACPVQLNVLFSAIKQDSKMMYSFNSVFEIKDPAMKTNNDVIKQSALGNGTNEINGSSRDFTENIEYKAASEIISISRGSITTLSFVKAKIHLINRQIESVQFEESNEFKFPDHSILIQRMTVKTTATQTRTAYYFNGASLSVEAYNRLKKGLGYQSIVVNKL